MNKRFVAILHIEYIFENGGKKLAEITLSNRYINVAEIKMFDIYKEHDYATIKIWLKDGTEHTEIYLLKEVEEYGSTLDIGMIVNTTISDLQKLAL